MNVLNETWLSLDRQWSLTGSANRWDLALIPGLDRKDYIYTNWMALHVT